MIYHESVNSPGGKKLSWSRRIVLGLFCVLQFCLFFRTIEIEDIWWQLSVGQWIVQHGTVPRFDPFSFLSPAPAWVINQWLGDVFYYLIYAAGGYTGLQIFRAVFFILLLGIFFLYASRRIPFYPLVILCWLMVYGLLSRCFLKPDVFNWLFVQIFLLVLFWYWEGGPRRILLVIPLAGLAWVNINFGSLLYGVLTVSVFVLCALVRVIENARLKKTAQEQKKSWACFTTLSGVWLVYLSTFALTPYGVNAVLEPFKIIFAAERYDFAQTIAEMKPPVYLFFATEFHWQILMLWGAVAVALNRRDQLLHAALFFIALFMFLGSSRASVFFLIINGYVIARSTMWERLRPWLKSVPLRRLLESGLCIIICLLLSLQIGQRWNERIYVKGQFSRDMAEVFSPYELTDEIEFLRREGVEGVVLSDDMFGGFLIWHAFPRLKPFIDPRHADIDLWTHYVALMRAPAKVWPAVEAHFQIRILMLNAGDFSSLAFVRYINQRPDWQLVFIDGPTVIYLKRGVWDLSPEAQQFESWLRQQTYSQADVQSLLDSQEPGPHGRPAKYFKPTIRYLDLQEEGMSLYDLGYTGAALQRLAAAARVAPEFMAPVSKQLILDLQKGN